MSIKIWQYILVNYILIADPIGMSDIIDLVPRPLLQPVKCAQAKVVIFEKVKMIDRRNGNVLVLFVVLKMRRLPRLNHAVRRAANCDELLDLNCF